MLCSPRLSCGRTRLADMLLCELARQHCQSCWRAFQDNNKPAYCSCARLRRCESGAHAHQAMRKRAAGDERGK